jgi:hypothetical protein
MIPTTALMMGTEMVPETSAIFNQLAFLMAGEDFINLIHMKEQSLPLS